MNLPLLTQNDIRIEEPRQTAGELDSGSYRLVARLELGADCRISKREERAAIFSIRDHAVRLLKTHILRRVYPVEIRKEIRDIKIQFCSMPDSMIQHTVSRDLYERLNQLEDALSPEVK